MIFLARKKRPTGIYRRISHNIIISHKEQVGQHIQNRNEKFVRKHKNECQNSYILPIVFFEENMLFYKCKEEEVIPMT